MIFSGMEETMYVRKGVEGVEVLEASVDPIHTPNDANAATKEKFTPSESTSTPASTTGNSSLSSPTTKPKPYIQKMALFTKMEGRPTNKQLFTLMHRPLLIM